MIVLIVSDMGKDSPLFAAAVDAAGIEPDQVTNVADDPRILNRLGVQHVPALIGLDEQGRKRYEVGDVDGLVGFQAGFDAALLTPAPVDHRLIDSLKSELGRLVQLKLAQVELEEDTTGTQAQIDTIKAQIIAAGG